MQEIPYRFDKAATIDELNFLLEKVYSNLVIDDQKILTYTLQSPFKEFVEKGFVLKSARINTSLEPEEIICLFNSNLINFNLKIEDYLNNKYTFKPDEKQSIDLFA